MEKPKNISVNAQLLTGVGASSWFEIGKEESLYRIKRYSEEGDLECSRLFSVNSEEFNINKDYQFTYISNCKQCKIIQNNKIFIFKTNDYEY
ncbi:MAG: hypothetical protein CMD22_05710 [Flavobacteriales bacterium]|nr:hypothetical protein [Flavobacteriales bacterium]|tara:strand:- start:4045 stop:4320 length:276 start_codon:yes stop_codon:yes gene_type:complete